MHEQQIIYTLVFYINVKKRSWQKRL